MRYFKAYEMATKPLLIFSQIKDFVEGDPLVVEEGDIPTPVYGVCPLKIVAGELVERTAPEMSAFEEEYEIATALRTQENLTDVIEKESFSYLGMEFPMNQTARLRYSALLEQETASYNVLDMIGRIIPLTDTDTPLLVAAMNAKIITLTNP